MLKLNLNHASFDLAMEVLACIPPSPGSVPIKLVADDLGMQKQAAVYEALDAIRGYRGITVTRFNRGGVRCLAVARESWPLARVMAEEYMTAVYRQPRD